MFIARYRHHLLCGVAALIVLGLFLHAPIPQDPGFHQFADQRNLGQIANFFNVGSNALFFLVGVAGLLRVRQIVPPASQALPAYITLCSSVALVSLGSAFYHLAPGNLTLIWDRMPIAIAFMALFSMLLHERVLRANAPATLWPLVGAGLLAAGYWLWTEQHGVGDLRAYALVQFLPIALMPLILWLFPGQYLNNTWLWRALLLYGVAKLAEHFDLAIFDALRVLSGHSIKHMLAAWAAWCIILALPVTGRVSIRGTMPA
jgi:hypothetical protein